MSFYTYSPCSSISSFSSDENNLESSNQSNQSNEMTEEEWNQYYPTFNSQTEYLFVNKCLTLIHGPLPSYAYFESNDEIQNFWNELEDEYYPVIYNYLIEIEFIDDINSTELDSDNFEHQIYMKNAVIDFIFTYFENRL
jgi:hypothetical protein